MKPPYYLFCLGLISCGDNGAPPQIEKVEKLAIPTQAIGVLSLPIAKRLFLDIVYENLDDEIHNLHRSILPRKYLRKDNAPKMIRFIDTAMTQRPDVLSGYAEAMNVDDSQNKYYECSLKSDQKWEDKDLDHLPENASGEYHCRDKERRPDSEIIESQEDLSFSISDNDDLDPVSGYAEELSYSGRIQRDKGKQMQWPELLGLSFIYPSPSGWAEKHIESTKVTQSAGFYKIHTKKQKSSENADGKKAAIAYAMDLEIAPSLVEVEREGVKYPFLSKTGVIKSMTGLLGFQFEGSSYALKISGEKLIYAEHGDGPESTGNCELNTFDQGQITWEDSAGNKLFFISERLEPTPNPNSSKRLLATCSHRILFNDQEIYRRTTEAVVEPVK